MAIEAYYQDHVEESLALATELGVSNPNHEWWYRRIEAEAVTRQQSTVVPVDELISLEYVPHEVHHSERIIAEIAKASSEVRTRFGWSEGAKVMVSVLAEETDAPWTVGRAGYMMDKYPYDKICLPRNATHASEEFERVVRHEYAHVMVLILSEGKATTYLHEAVTMIAENTVRPEDWHGFVTGREPWLPPLELTNAFNDLHDPSRFHARSLAYSQSAALGFYLSSIGGETKIGNLLRGFGDNSNWTEIKMAVTSQSAADEALREVYGFGETDLFSQAHEWLKSTFS